MTQRLRTDTLQWFIGSYLAIRGVLMLIVPHKLSTPAFIPIQAHFPWLGAWQVLGGIGLIAASTLFPRRSIIVFAHLVAGGALLQAGFGHVLSGAWTSVVSFSVLGLGTAIAPLLTRPPRLLKLKPADYFSFLMGLRLILEGAVLVAPFNPQFAAPVYEPIRSWAWVYGVLYGLAGAALLTVNLRPQLPRSYFQVAHLLAGGMLWAWTLSLGIPTWNSLLYFGGLGTLLALLPWLGPRLRQVDPAALHTQLAVTLVGIVTLPLLLIVALVSIPQEQAVLDRVMIVQQTLATALSQDIASYVNLHQAAAVALSNQPRLLTLSAAEQQVVLRSFQRAYPNMEAFTTYDAAGTAIARSDDQPLISITESSPYQTVRQTKQPTIEIRLGRVIQHPLLIFWVPILESNGQFAGMVGGAIRATQITEHLGKTSTDASIQIYVVDSQGKVIAHPDRSLIYNFTDYSDLPPVSTLLQRREIGGLRYWNGKAWTLAGYAPIPGLDWGVIVERPVSEVLTTIYNRRNRDFELLVLVAVITLMIASLLARRLTRPLTVLAYAADQMATGNPKVPLPRSRITEMAHLSAVFGSMRDRLTQQTQERNRLLEREREAREAAESANRIKDEFLAVLSHELRSPLNPIMGWAKLLRSRKFDQQATDRALETIERNAKLQTQLIEDLLDVSRILQGKLVLRVGPVNLNSTLDAALETVRLSAEAKGVHLHKVAAPNQGSVMGDAGRLQQILWNLLSNAVKFTPPGGQVTIHLDYPLLNPQPPTPNSQPLLPHSTSQPPTPNPQSPIPTACAQITVTDTGQGIAPEFLPYVFDYFRQADGTTTRQFGGLGLGLAIVRHLTELHGGTIWADSQGAGQGATFTLQLPLSAIALESGHTPEPHLPPCDLSHFRILVVDDEADMRQLILAILTQCQAEVQTVGSAAEAFSALEAFQPHLLISDIGMPQMDGYMFLRQLRQLPPDRGGQIPAIALTAYAGELNQKRALLAGFQTHLAKPVEPAELMQAISALIKAGLLR